MSDETRDNGPYLSTQQVSAQYQAWSRELPEQMPPHEVVRMLLTESLMIAGVKVSSFEWQVLRSRGLDAVFAQVLSGWLLRASLAGGAASLPSDNE